MTDRYPPELLQQVDAFLDDLHTTLRAAPRAQNPRPDPPLRLPTTPTPGSRGSASGCHAVARQRPRFARLQLADAVGP